MKLLKHYKNGNYFVSIFEDGTKIRQTNEDEFIPMFPENIDMKISDRCDRGCEMCFTEDTKILMGDFSYKYIKDIKIGDVVIGFEEKASKQGAKRGFFKTKVLKTFQHVESELIKIITDTGNSITSTPNHPFLSQGTGKNHVKVFNKIENIPVGGFLFETGFPNIDINYNSDNYKLGYVIGSWIGDGAIWKGVDKKGYEAYSCRFVTKDEEINERVFDFTTHFNADFYYLDFEMTGNGIKKSVRSNKKSSYEFLTNIINSNLDINTNIEYCCGLLAGMFDSEGHIDKQRNIIRIANTNVRYIKEVERCLNLLNIENTTESHKQHPSSYSKGYLPVYNVRVKGKYGWNKFLWYTKPICVRKSFEHNVSNNVQHWKSYIVNKQKIEDKCYVYNFETECHTYVANNFMVHNCHENSTKYGKIAHFNHKFLDTLKAGQEIACISGDSVVYDNKGAKEIKDLKVGDYIFDSDNNLRKIINIQKSNKNVYLLKGDKGFNIKCSKDHPFISNNCEVKAEDLIQNKMDFLKTKELANENYSIDMSKYIKPANPENGHTSRGGAIIDENTVRLRNSTKHIPKIINLSNDLMYLYGWFVAEGSTKGLSMNINEYEDAIKLGDIWNNTFNTSYKIYKNEEKNSLALELQSQTLIEDLFYNEMKVNKGARNVSIGYLFNIDNKEFVRQALLGLFDGDGCYRVRKSKKSESMAVSLKTVSKKLAYEVVYLLAKHFGIYASLHYGISKERKMENRILKESDYYQVCIYNFNDISKLFPERVKIDKTNNKNIKISKFKSLTKVENETLYDITLEEGSSHIFPVNGYILTHNCGGGNIFENTELESFLIRMKNQGVFCNITIHQVHAEENIELISKWINEKLVRGVGVSYNNDYEQIDRIFNKLEQLNSTTSNIILHTINGIHNFTDLIKLNDKKNKKVLILGYKSVRRGLEFIQDNNDKITQSQQSMYNNLEALSKTFKVLSFDNLAIEQLEVKRIIPKDKWSEFFMGSDSEFTCFIDLCKEDFAVNSCEVEHRHKLLDRIEDIFKVVKEDGIKYGYKK